MVEKNANLDNNLNSVPDQIDSFISSDTEPDATEFSDTLDILDNIFKNKNQRHLVKIYKERRVRPNTK